MNRLNRILSQEPGVKGQEDVKKSLLNCAGNSFFALRRGDHSCSWCREAWMYELRFDSSSLAMGVG